MADTAKEIDGFASTMRKRSHRRVGDAKQIAGRIANVRGSFPLLPDEREIGKYVFARQKTLNELVTDYLVSVLSARYPLIDEALFTRRRWLAFEDNKLVADKAGQPPSERSGRRRYEVPLFCVVPLAGDRRLVLVDRQHTVNHPVHHYSVHVRVAISTTLPPVPHEILTAGHKAVGRFHAAISSAYANPDIAPLLGGLNLAPELTVAWIPTVKSLAVKTTTAVSRPARATISPEVPLPRPGLDPALMLEVAGKRFLVALYDIPHEEPIEAMLREFTSGPMDEVVRKK